jgi:hypothetical protein
LQGESVDGFVPVGNTSQEHGIVAFSRFIKNTNQAESGESVGVDYRSFDEFGGSFHYIVDLSTR